jgi:hypothetical protein
LVHFFLVLVIHQENLATLVWNRRPTKEAVKLGQLGRLAGKLFYFFFAFIPTAQLRPGFERSGIFFCSTYVEAVFFVTF